MNMLAPSTCEKRGCKWLDGVVQPDGTEMTEAWRCPAFPEGIPADIAFGTNAHTTRDRRQTGDQTFEQGEPYWLTPELKAIRARQSGGR
jgi:hypothetical protein